MGDPIDTATHGPLPVTRFYPVLTGAPDPLKRRIIQHPLSLGVRALDGLLTCGEGQRLGVFAAAGGGKSTLMAMLVKGADVDVTVVALIGERGREVREFLEHELGEEGRRRAVIVCATSDKSSMERSKAAYVATAIAQERLDCVVWALLTMLALIVLTDQFFWRPMVAWSEHFRLDTSSPAHPTRSSLPRARHWCGQ
jgi:flagellar biosynthesis/type III secretory pathway ATPase